MEKKVRKPKGKKGKIFLENTQDILQLIDEIATKEEGILGRKVEKNVRKRTRRKALE